MPEFKRATSQSPARREHAHQRGPAGGSPAPAPDPASAEVLRLQGAAGNAAVAALVGATAPGAAVPVQLDPAPAAAAAPAGSAPTTAAPGPGGGPTPGADPSAAPEVTLYPIWDIDKKTKVFVDAKAYEVERERLGRYLRFLAKEIPADAKQVLDDYPYPEISEEYKDIIDSLTKAGEAYAKGNLLSARGWANDTKRWTGMEIKGHKLFEQESALSYVGKRVGAAFIGFFEGAAEAVTGLVDSGAGLIGFHPDLEETIHKRYDVIFEAYGGAAGLDTTIGNERNIGRVGGKFAENLATGKAIGELGELGTAINLLQAGAGVKGAVQTVIALKESGKSWSEIASNPVVIAQVAGALAGAAGAGGSLAPEAKEFLDAATGVLTVTQIGGLTVALTEWKDDPNLSPEENKRRHADMIADVLTATGTLVQHGAAIGEKAPTPDIAPTGEAGTAGETAPTGESAGAGSTTEPQKGEATAVPIGIPETGAPSTGETVPRPGPEAGPSDELIRDASKADVGGPTEEPKPEAIEQEGPPVYDPASAGIRPKSAAALDLLANQLDVVIKVRPVNLESVPHLEQGALSKMELVKAKTINALDELIGAPPDRRGLVGLFEPHEPVLPPGTPPDVATKAQERFQRRAAEWKQLKPYYDQYAAEGLVSIDNGVLKVADPRAAGTEAEPHGAMKAVAGDIDVFEITHSDGSPLTRDQQAVVTGMLQSMGIGVEHGAHVWWPEQSPGTYDPAMDARIRAQHTQGQPDAEPLVAFAPGSMPRPVWAGEVVTGQPRPVGPDGTPMARTPTGERAFEPLADMQVVGTPEAGTPGAGSDEAGYVDIGAEGGGPAGPEGPGGPAGAGPGGGGEPVVPRMILFHGTDAVGFRGFDAEGQGRINVNRPNWEGQDFGHGFYLTEDRATAEGYAKMRAGQRGGPDGGGMQATVQFEVPIEQLGTVVDVRPGGPHAEAWQAYLDGESPMRGMAYREFLNGYGVETRGIVFEQFLASIGMENADAIIGPLGGTTATQVCIRSQTVADVLNAQIRGPGGP